jgi:hypothetical protein
LVFAVDAGFATARDRVLVEAASSAPRPSSEQNQSECEATVRRMWTYLDGRCSTADGQRVAEHLDACVRCASHFEFAAQFLRALAAAPVFSEFDVRLRTRVVGVLADAGFGGR